MQRYFPNIEKRKGIYLGSILFPVFFFFVFSFDFHFLWLFYDIAAIFILIKLMVLKSKFFSISESFFLVLTLIYFFTLSVLSGHLLFGLLSCWDTFKHLIYLVLIKKMLNVEFDLTFILFEKRMSKLIIVLFLFQMIAVFFQYYAGYHFDDISGTFGAGGSHIVGYFSLLFVVVLYVKHANNFEMFSGLVIVLLMNAFSENAGFIVLLIILVVGILYADGKLKNYFRMKNFLIVSFFLLVLMVFLNTKIYSEQGFLDVILTRLSDVLSPGDRQYYTDSYGRGFVMNYAAQLGGWFGQGPGAFSNIYNFIGFDYQFVVNELVQINISEVTHLLAESGFIGLLLTVVVYSVFLNNIFESSIYRSVVMSLLIFSMLYSAVLMNESQTFIFILIVFYLRLLEKRKILIASSKRLRF